jgi:hypothetical protein
MAATGVDVTHANLGPRGGVDTSPLERANIGLALPYGAISQHAAAARRDEPFRRRAELKDHKPVTSEDAQRAAQRAKEAHQRAENAHRTAARLHDQAAAPHDRAAEIHERAQADHIGDDTVHRQAVQKHRDAARWDRGLAEIDQDRAVSERVD